MPFNRKGGDLSPVVNEQTGRIDYAFGDDGNPIFDDTKAFAVASLVLQQRGKWIPDAKGNRGSLIYTVRNDTKATPSKLQAYTLDGIQPLVDEGEITGPNGEPDPVVVVTGTKGKRRLDITYSTPKGGPQTTKVPL